MVIKYSNLFYEIFHCKTERNNQKNISCDKSEIPRFSPFLFIALGHKILHKIYLYSTLKEERFVCENKKCLTKLFSRLIDIFACLKHEVKNDL